MSAEMVLPPGLDTEDGEPRTIGVEIEFAGMSCEQAAGLVRDLFGGRIKELDRYWFEVNGTRLGSFTVELDSQYAHHNDDDRAGSGWKDIGRAVRDGVTTAIATVSSLSFW